MDLITSSIAGAIAQATLSAVSARGRASLGGEFEPEIRQILNGVQQMRKWLGDDRRALLLDGFAYILQDDLDEARRSLTQARNREPRSAVVRYWLSLVLAVQGRAGAEAEMREALTLNPYLAAPTTGRGAARPGPPAGQRPIWGRRLAGRDAEVTYGSLGGSPLLNPQLWIAGRIAKPVSKRLERFLFSRAHIWRAASSSIMTISLGTGDALVAWATQWNPGADSYQPQIGLLSMFDAESGALRWHRWWADNERPLLATPRMIAQPLRSGEYGLFSPATGAPLETLPASYFETLIAPPHIWGTDGYAAAHATTAHMDLAWDPHAGAPWIGRPPLREPPRSPFTETLVVQPPTVAWPGVPEAARSKRFILAAENDYQQIGRRLGDHILCRSQIMLFDSAAALTGPL
ncbi:tetratricopeptide repeat protein [Modestobacter marinus]|uniref:tetratricopeptide repeat protein n=1 Tax=Modestobacter marinus TaxID=477641 RepID=UPI001C967BD2|nr:hypothetical protein [Modestobacter marinus]